MNFGKLNKRIVLKKIKTSAPDSIGGATVAYETAKTTWGSLSPLSAREIILYGMEVGQRSYRARFRFDKAYNIDQTYYLEWTDPFDTVRQFRVVSVLNIDEDKKVIELLVNERTD